MAGIAAYGIDPIAMTEADSRRAHGVDEKIPTASLEPAFRFFHDARSGACRREQASVRVSDLPDGGDLVVPCDTLDLDVNLIPNTTSEQCRAQWRLGSDDLDELSIEILAHSSSLRHEKTVRAFAFRFELYYRGRGDGCLRAELFEIDVAKQSEESLQFGGALGLCAGEIGGFEAAGIVLVLGLALRMDRGFPRGERRLGQDGKIRGDSGLEFFEELSFVHTG